MALRK